MDFDLWIYETIQMNLFTFKLSTTQKLYCFTSEVPSEEPIIATCPSSSSFSSPHKSRQHHPFYLGCVRDSRIERWRRTSTISPNSRQTILLVNGEAKMDDCIRHFQWVAPAQSADKSWPGLWGEVNVLCFASSSFLCCGQKVNQDEKRFSPPSRLIDGHRTQSRRKVVRDCNDELMYFVDEEKFG